MMMNPVGTLNALSGPMRTFGCDPHSGYGRTPSYDGSFGGTQSITKAMDNFLSAVGTMKDVVMVPTRLKDVKYFPKSATAPVTDVNNNSVGGKGMMNVASAPILMQSAMMALNCGGCNCSLHTVARDSGGDCSPVPSDNSSVSSGSGSPPGSEQPLSIAHAALAAAAHLNRNTTNTSIIIGSHQPVEDPDLLLCYKMVDAVCNDLVNGPAFDPVLTTAVQFGGGNKHRYPRGGSRTAAVQLNSNNIYKQSLSCNGTTQSSGLSTTGTLTPVSSRGQSPAFGRPPSNLGNNNNWGVSHSLIKHSCSMASFCSATSNHSNQSMLIPTPGDMSIVDSSDRFAFFVRAQVQSFLSAIQQLTEMATYLTRTYQEMIGMPEDRLTI